MDQRRLVFLSSGLPAAGERWQALAEAILGAGFTVVNSQPVKSEMAVATPKSAAQEPIAFDIILVCRKQPLAPTDPKHQRGGTPTRQPGAAHTKPKREPGGSPTRQQGAAHTNPKRQRGSTEVECQRSSTAIECERSCTDSRATYQSAAGAPASIPDALASARSKIDRLLAAGFALSRNDRKIIVYGQLLTTLASARNATNLAALVDSELSRDRAIAPVRHRRQEQQALFEQR